jgi:hypothetical protein
MVHPMRLFTADIEDCKRPRLVVAATWLLCASLAARLVNVAMQWKNLLAFSAVTSVADE